MDDQNSTERSVGFFSLSVILHVLVVVGILAGAAYRATQGEGSKGETVSMEMVEGDSDTQATSATPSEEPAAVTEKPVVQEKPVEKIEPVVTKPVEKPVAKAQPVVAAKPIVKAVPVAKTKPVAAAKPAAKPQPKAVPTETQDSEDAPEVAVAPTPTHETEKVDAQTSEETQEQPSAAVAEEPKAEPVAAVPARPAAEPKAEAPVKEEASSGATTATAEEAQGGTVTQGDGNGEGIAKGDGSGDTPEDAKAFTDLRQKPGNRSPKYPMSSRRAKQEGQVELMYFVTKQGTVEQIKISKSSGYAGLDREAMQSIQTYKYYPGQEGWTTHPITFSLQGEAQQVGGLRHKEP